MLSKITKKLIKNPVIREWVESLIIAVVLALFIRTFFIQAFKIPTGSMRMTLVEGDRIFVNKVVFGAKVPFSQKRLPGLRDPEPGDIIVFVYPGKPKKDFIKRLIAVGGETVEIRFGDVYVNSRLVDDHRIKNTTYYNNGPYGKAGEVITVPDDHYFVLGDNSKSSADSRFWGFVPKDNVIGKAVIIYWPFNRLRYIQ